jgi:hypothetical protein
MRKGRRAVLSEVFAEQDAGLDIARFVRPVAAQWRCNDRRCAARDTRWWAILPVTGCLRPSQDGDLLQNEIFTTIFNEVFLIGSTRE